MPPDSIRVEIDDRALREGLAQLLERGTDLAPVLAGMGEYLALAHDDRFERRVTPDGGRWATVSKRHAQRKAAGKAGDKSRRGRTRDPSDILELTGQLRDTLAYQVQGDGLEFGSNLEYAAYHQFGTRRGLPDRPFLGISLDDEQELLRILRSHLEP